MRWLSRLFARQVKVSRRPARLTVESLEERCVPATLVVNTTIDEMIPNATLSLREAVNVVNTQSLGGLTPAEKSHITGTLGVNDTITLAGLSGTMTLKYGEMMLGRSVTIQGAAAHPVKIDAVAASRVFEVTANSSTIKLANLTLANGLVSDNGGAVTVDSSSTPLTLVGMTIQGSTASAGSGGGIFSPGPLTLQGCVLTGNSASNSGGGFLTQSSATITGGRIAGNAANFYGGGFLALGTVTLTSATISGNTATSNQGGGFYTYSNATVTGAVITGNTTLEGSGAGFYAKGNALVTNATIAGNTAGNDGGGFATAGTATVRGSRLFSNTALSYGGGFFARGNATVTSSSLTGNHTTFDDGGGFETYGTATVTSATLSGNFAGCCGGGFYARSTATVTNATITGNTAANRGGGVYTYGGGSIANSTIAGNASEGGGGLFNGSSSSLTILNSTLSGNTGGFGGGGIVNFGALTLKNSTLSGNVAGATAEFEGYGGGGILNFNTLTLVNCTVAFNVAQNGGIGGGILDISEGGGIVLQNTIIARNSAPMSSSNDISVFVPALVQFCLIQDTNGLLLAPGSTRNILGVDPLLGPLANNGGPTQTHMLLAGSPARGHGSLALASGLSTDPRGFPRSFYGSVDIGAVQASQGAGAVGRRLGPVP
jgi:hypothetical protein